MLIIGCDYHPSVQQVAFVDTETGEDGKHRLKHSEGEAEKFYRDLKLKGVSARVGLEATGHTRWSERLLAELGYELWIGDAAQITAMRVMSKKWIAPTFTRRFRPFNIVKRPSQLPSKRGGRIVPSTRSSFRILRGHVSVQTTESYLGCKQRLHNAVNDLIGIEPD